MSDLSAADIAEGHRLDKAATPGPWEQDDTEIYRKDAYDHRGRKVWVAAADLASEQSGREDAELIVWARNHLPALLDAAEKLDRATDLFEKWAAEESEHRAAGEYGIAEGLHVAIEELRYAVHGTYEKPYPDGLRERQREPEEPADQPHRIDVTHVAPGELERMARSGARPSPELRAAIDRARDRKGADRG